MNMKKVLGVACAATMACCANTACSSIPLDSQHGIADQSRLYGMCYLMEERSVESLNIEKEVELMKNMGVKSVRQWMNFQHFMKSPTELRENCEATANMHKLIAECEKAGMMNIGMNHHNFSLDNVDNGTAKPYKRDISEGSNYVKWLENYYESWKTLVTEFPEIKYWEMDNELNNPDFMWDGVSHSSYSMKEMAAIATDMFYYAARGIHEANPNAETVMSGLTEPTGLGSGNLAKFFQQLYDNIASGEYGYFYGKEDKAKASKNADDYFQIACWHPYMSNFNQKNFIDINNEYYEIILRNEGKHKKVFFTEIGWNDKWMGGEQKAISAMTLMFEAVETMPYVETVNIFKLYDVGKKGNWDDYDETRFGLIHDPNPTRVYYKLDIETESINIAEDGRCINGAPKNKAYVYQRLAGGTGSLEVLMNK